MSTLLGYYTIIDAGDGSAIVRFFKTEEAAKKEVERQEEKGNFPLTDGGYEALHIDEFKE